MIYTYTSGFGGSEYHYGVKANSLDEAMAAGKHEYVYEIPERPTISDALFRTCAAALIEMTGYEEVTMPIVLDFIQWANGTLPLSPIVEGMRPDFSDIATAIHYLVDRGIELPVKRLG